VPWVGELRDLWTDNHYYPYPRWRRWIEGRIERRVLSSAAGLVTVSEPLAGTLRTKFGRPTAVILNGFDPNDYPCRSAISFQRDALHIVYTGTLYPGRQTLAPLFDALRRLGPLSNKVRVDFYGPRSSIVRETADLFGVEHLIELKGAVSHHEALSRQSGADVLLHLLWTDTSQPGVYNAKLFEYLGARRPILGVGYTENVAAELIRERGAGVTLDDPAKIAAQLEQWVRQKEQTGSIPDLDASVVAGLSREEQTKVLEGFIAQVLS
jgi:glycosyltransferase involved in cell wall biosynthesis